MSLMKRKDVAEELKWDLSHIFSTANDFEKAVDSLEPTAQKIVQTYKGTLTTADSIQACLSDYASFQKNAWAVIDYASLGASVDFTDATLQETESRVMRIIANCESMLCFIKDELVALDETVLQKVITDCPKYACYLNRILKEKPHTLSYETEVALSSLSTVLEAPYTIYNTTKLADIQFEPFTVDGKEYPMGYSMFEDHYEYVKETAIRRGAYQNFYNKLQQYQNVTAVAYNTQVQYEKAMANMRGFSSVFDYLLFSQQVDAPLYHRQIDLIMEELAPHMRKYAKLLQKEYGLETMTHADLKLPLDPDFSMEVTREKAEAYVRSALSVMGEDYMNVVDKVFTERRIDYAQNEGKSTGGFCESVYQNGSYILLTWQGTMADVFTIAHEVGHAGHFALADANQNILDREVSIYFVEAPSTINELLFADYLIKENDDKRFRRWVLASLIGNTYYHNFVTHFLEAAYQREVYRIVDAGGSVSADTLSNIYRDTLRKFWGDAVELPEGCELTWMRQPHYYSGLYSYTYSVGLTIVTEVARRIREEGEIAVKDWKQTLSLGGTKTPVELAQVAGVDIKTEEALRNTIRYIGSIIDEICELTEELNR